MSMPLGKKTDQGSHGQMEMPATYLCLCSHQRLISSLCVVCFSVLGMGFAHVSQVSYELHLIKVYR